MSHVPLLVLQVDGATGVPSNGVAGLGIVVRNSHGHIVLSRSLRARAQTNNEAEYHAIIAGLELMVRQFPHVAVQCVSDSESVVAQLRGEATLRASAHKPLHERVLALVKQLYRVEFVLIGRACNRLADALAWEAVGGRGAFLAAIQKGVLQRDQH